MGSQHTVVINLELPGLGQERYRKLPDNGLCSRVKRDQPGSSPGPRPARELT